MPMLIAQLQLLGISSMHQWQLTDILRWGMDHRNQCEEYATVLVVCSGVIWRGSGCFFPDCSLDMACRHFSTVLFTHWSMPGNHTFSLSSCCLYQSLVTFVCKCDCFVSQCDWNDDYDSFWTLHQICRLSLAHLSLSWRLWTLSDLHPDTLLQEIVSLIPLLVSHYPWNTWSCLALGTAFVVIKFRYSSARNLGHSCSHVECHER